MDELSRLADYVTVLRDGRLIAEYRVQQTSTEEIIRLMVGRERRDLFIKGEHPKGEVALEVCELSLEKRLENRSFKLEQT